jgi:hypothetical protein
MKNSGRVGANLNKYCDIDVRIFAGLDRFYKKVRVLGENRVRLSEAYSFFGKKWVRFYWTILTRKTRLRRAFRATQAIRLAKSMLVWRTMKVASTRRWHIQKHLFSTFRAKYQIKKLFSCWYTGTASPLLRNGFRHLKRAVQRSNVSESLVVELCKRQAKASTLLWWKYLLKAQQHYKLTTRRMQYVLFRQKFLYPNRRRRQEKLCACRRQFARMSNITLDRATSKKKSSLHFAMCSYVKYMFRARDYSRRKGDDDYSMAIARQHQQSRCKQRSMFAWRDNMYNIIYTREKHFFYYLSMSLWNFMRRINRRFAQKRLLYIADNFYKALIVRRLLRRWCHRMKRMRTAQYEDALASRYFVQRKQTFVLHMLSSVAFS